MVAGIYKDRPLHLPAKTNHFFIELTQQEHDMTAIDVSELGIKVQNILRNMAPSQLYEEAIRGEPGTAISAGGALVAYSGTKTGRSPSDKRVIQTPQTESDIWWGSVNIPLDKHGFEINRERAIDYLNTRSHLCLLYTSPSPRDLSTSRMPSSA